MTHPIVRYLLATVWLINGLLCKVLGLIPRHEQIVAVILGDRHAHLFTVLIGFGELAIALWIVVGWKYQWCAAVQIGLVLVMNAIEFFLAPGLLLWGRFNSVFALGLAAIIYLNAFGRQKR